VTINYLDGQIPNSLDITLDPPIKDVNDGYNRVLALFMNAVGHLGMKVLDYRWREIGISAGFKNIDSYCSHPGAHQGTC
jgi:hypothetical protein